MKNKKGFTLIELLAVIVILAVIMVIAVPKILDVIESSRNSAADSSLKLVRSAIKTQVTTASMSSANFTKEDGCYLFDFTNNNSNVQNLSLKNKDKVSGSIKYCSGKLNDDTLVWDGQTGNNTQKIEKPTLTIDLDNDGQADIGDTISIGEEKFYVIKNDGSIISMLAYYNLNAGGIYNGSTWDPYKNPTYLQDETMKGYDVNSSNSEIRYGTVPFADNSGWAYTDNETIDTSHYNSYLRTALEKYGEIITKSMGKEITARLITKSEIEEVVNDGESMPYNILKAKADEKGISWIYSSSYWTGSACDSAEYYVWFVPSDGIFNASSYHSNNYNGVRPVLDISVSDL